MRILIIEDDPMIGASLRNYLRGQTYAADWITEGESAAGALAAQPYDAVILDLGLPGQGGLDVLRELRASGNSVPVLILTANDATAGKIAGLDAGADDYLVKPFDPGELGARLRALLRRRAGRAGPLIRHRDLVLDPGSHGVTQAGVDVPLSAKEFALLHALLERPGQVLSRSQLEDRLYGWGEEVESNAVDVHVHGLRRKLGAGFIVNIRGVGWRVAP
jgi:two-component system, OmpR family, response regulator QseB